MRWLIKFLFRRRDIKSERVKIIQKIILKKYLLR
jgi:hypothetical protein